MRHKAKRFASSRKYDIASEKSAVLNKSRVEGGRGYLVHINAERRPESVPHMGNVT